MFSKLPKKSRFKMILLVHIQKKNGELKDMFAVTKITSTRSNVLTIDGVKHKATALTVEGLPKSVNMEVNEFIDKIKKTHHPSSIVLTIRETFSSGENL